MRSFGAVLWRECRPVRNPPKTRSPEPSSIVFKKIRQIRSEIEKINVGQKENQKVFIWPVGKASAIGGNTYKSRVYNKWCSKERIKNSLLKEK